MRFKKRSNPVLDSSPSAKRLARMDTSELSTYGGTLVMYLGASYDQWNYHDGPKEEVSECLEILQMVWHELSSRSA